MNEDVVIMNKNDQKIYTLACDVLYGKLSIKEFSILINKSYRQSQRIIARINKNGMKALEHGNKNRIPWNKTPESLQNYILDIYKRYYSEFNLLHFAEKLKEKHGIVIKRETLRKWAHQQDIVKYARRRSKRRAHPLRPRMPQEGLLVQFDGSEHAWFGSSRPICTLIGGIDDATGKILHLEFFGSEDTFSCMKTMSEIIRKNGIPEAFYLDRAGHFGKPYLDQERTQIGRALKELNCRIILASTPQAKGRIERLWRTLQDRLIAELHHQRITTVRAGNDYLIKTFIPDFNQRFSIEPRVNKKAYSNAPNDMKLKRIFCIKEQRRINTGNYFSYGGEKFQIIYNTSLRFRYVTILLFEDNHREYEVLGEKVKVAQLGNDTNENVVSIETKKAS